MTLGDFEVLKRLGKFTSSSIILLYIGEGAYSSVFHVRRIADQQIYALKKVKLGKLSDKEKENALNEVRLLASIDHHCICSYKEAFIDD